MLGIPVSIVEFDRRRYSGVPWEYGEQMGAWDADARGVFTALYQEIGEAASDLFAMAAKTQIKIYCCATLSDLKAALSLYDVVIVLAHWRGSAVSVADLLPGWEGRVRDLVESPGVFSVALRSLCNEWIKDSGENFSRALSRGIERGDFRPCFPAGVAHLEMSPLLSAALSRDIVDQAFGSHLRRGNTLELFDGMHSGMTVVGAIQSEFRGTLDLSCCTSSVLATSIRVVRGDTLAVISNDESIPPDYQMRVIEGALWLSRHGRAGGYARARREVAVGLGDWRRRSYRCKYL